MSIEKYTVTVTIEKEIEIEVNTDIINEKFFEEFSSYMWGVESVEEVLEYIAIHAAHYEGSFIEGVGEYPKSWERDKNLAEQGVHIVRISEDTSVEVDQ